MNSRLAHPRRAGLAAVAALSLCAVGVTTALAVDEVDAGRAIVVNPGSNFVELTGYPPNSDLQVEVKRGGVTVGSTVQHTDSGDVEINHAGGGDCWQGLSTPDIKGGDELVVTVVGSDLADTDSANVRDIELDSAETVGDTIVLSGHAQSHPDAALGTGTVTASIRMPDFDDFRADQTITTEGPFSAVFDADDGVTPEVADEWDANPARADVTWVNGGETITTLADFGGDPPVAPGCPPLALNDITSRSHSAVNAANVNTDMTVNGVAAPGVASVQLSIDGADVGAAVEPAADGTWTATVPAAVLQGLEEGEFQLGAAFDGADPASETVLKDTIVPGAPTATPPAGTYSSSQFVSLNAGAPDVVQIRWTNGPGDPTQVYNGSAIPVTASQTLRALAVDAGGNPSGVASFAYVIQPAAGGDGGGGNDDGAPPTQNPGTQEPRVGGGTVITDPLQAFRVRSLRAPGRLSLRTARRRGVTARFLAPEGTQFVRASLFLHTSASQRRSRRLIKRLTFAVDGSGRYAARFSDRRTRRKLRRGVYTISVAPGSDATTFAEGTAKRFRIR